MTILSKRFKSDNFELQKSLKLSFTNIRGVRSNFVECESFLKLNSPDILALCETNLDDPIDSGNFSVKEVLPFARNVSLENSADSYLCFRLALLRSVSYFFFLYRSPSSPLCTAFNSISSNGEILSINPSTNVFLSLGTLTSIIRTA